MRQHQQQRRPRGGRSSSTHSGSSHSSSHSNHNNHSSNLGQNRRTSRHHVFDSNGPEGKIRGTAQQVHEKYVAMARDAASAGDRVTAENHYQHAEHYFRLWSVANEEEERFNNQARQQRFSAEVDDAMAMNEALSNSQGEFSGQGNDGQNHAEYQQNGNGADMGNSNENYQENYQGNGPSEQRDYRRSENNAPRRETRARSDNRRPEQNRDAPRRENWGDNRRPAAQGDYARSDAARPQEFTRQDASRQEQHFEAPVDVDGQQNQQQRIQPQSQPQSQVQVEPQGELYAERVNLDRVVSARLETRAPRAPAVRRERRPGPDAGAATIGQSPVAQLLSEREVVDA